MDVTDEPACESNTDEIVNGLNMEKNCFVLCGWSTIERSMEYKELPPNLADIITLKAIKSASTTIYNSGLVCKTPIIDGKTLMGPNKTNSLGMMESFGIKLENLQYSGSFKMRGATYQFSKLPDMKERELITISAGNYGTSFAFLAKQLDITKNATVFVPSSVNKKRQARIKAYGVKVDATIPQKHLVAGAEKYQKEHDAVFLHPFDDPNVLIGHASAGLEILDQIPAVDIILVCCGGGGFLAGVTAAIRLTGNVHTKVYGVEHELASTLFDSLEKDKIVPMKNDPSCTSCPGLSAPFPGKTPFKVFRAFGDGVILVSEEEILRTVKLLYDNGLVVEPSGAAAVACVLSNKVPNANGKKVVAFVTGGNVSPSELATLFGEPEQNVVSNQASSPSEVNTDVVAAEDESSDFYFSTSISQHSF